MAAEWRPNGAITFAAGCLGVFSAVQKLFGDFL